MNIQGYKPICSSSNSIFVEIIQVTEFFATNWMIFTRWNSKTVWSECACSFCSIYLSPLSKNSHFYFKNPSVNNEHLCRADTTKAWEQNHMWKEATQQSYSYSLAGARVQTKTDFTIPLSTPTSRCQTTSLSSHLLGCLVRDLNYGPWLVTASIEGCFYRCKKLTSHRTF